MDIRRKLKNTGLILLGVLCIGLISWFGRPVHTAAGKSQAGTNVDQAAGQRFRPQTDLISVTSAYTTHLPIISKPVTSLKNQVTTVSITLPQPVSGMQSSWCTWGWCSISPRLYHEPLTGGGTLIGWTDSGGDGHVSIVEEQGNVASTHNYPGTSIRGLVAHAEGTYAVLLWNADTKVMRLSKRNANGSQVWTTSVDGSLTSFNPGIGDSRLGFGDGRYAAYFAVHGDSGWVEGHEGDRLVFVSSDGDVLSGGWDWGCSHSMAELVSYHSGLGKFAPVCSSDCYASKGVLINDSQVVYRCDGNCGGLVSAQLGQIALAEDTWKLVFSAMDRPGIVGKGIGLATIDGNFQSSYVWLTNTDGQYERDPVIARIGTAIDSGRYLVGWVTTNNDTYRLGVIDEDGQYLLGPEEVSSRGIRWGNRDDSFRTRPDGSISWVQADPGSSTLHLYRLDGDGFLP